MPTYKKKNRFRIDENSVKGSAGDWFDYYLLYFRTAVCVCVCVCVCVLARVCALVLVGVGGCGHTDSIDTDTHMLTYADYKEYSHRHAHTQIVEIVHPDTRRRRIQTDKRTQTNRVSCIHRWLICAARRMHRELWRMQMFKRRMHSEHADTVVRMHIPSPDATDAEI